MSEHTRLGPLHAFCLFQMRHYVALLSLLLTLANGQQNDVDFWNVERPLDMANIQSLEVMCGKTHMEVQISFDRPFNGIIFSKGAVDQYNCIYVKPQTGATTYSFNIMYDQCGTKPDMNGKFYENNIVIQYDKDLIEVWDEAKRLRCEWYNDYEKGITKPPIRVSDLEVVELNFRGDNVDCWMEIQHGKGPWANPVTGIVPLGTTLTMVIGINDKQGEFDMRVKSCSANTENSRPIQLSDEHGCVLRPKMISKFMKIAGADTRASVVTYAFFHAFKFPDSMAVHIRCKVEICRYGCPDHCQKPNSYVAREQEVSSSINIPQYRPGPRFEAHKQGNQKIKRVDDELSNEIPQPKYVPDPQKLVAPAPEALPVPQHLVQDAPPPPQRVVQEALYDKNVRKHSEPDQSVAQRTYQNKNAHLVKNLPPPRKNDSPPPINSGPPPRYIPRPDTPPRPDNPPRPDSPPTRKIHQQQHQKPNFPETDKKSSILSNIFKLPEKIFNWNNEDQNRLRQDGGSSRVESEAIPVSLGVRPQSQHSGAVPTHRSDAKEGGPQVYPSSFNTNARPVEPIEQVDNNPDNLFPYGPRGLHFDKRSAEDEHKIREKRALNEEMGVASGYQVISEVDLAFKPSFEDGMGVTVFQGRIMPEEIVYGVCLPATGFSALFVLVSLLTVISVLVSGFVCYHRQLQKVAEEGAPAPSSTHNPERDWGIATLLRMPKA